MSVRRISSAPSARAAARVEQRQVAEQAEQIAVELRRSGAVVIDCHDDDQARERARVAGRKAGRLINRSVRTTILPDGRVGIWDNERADHPLQSRLDRRRANRALDAAYRRRGPLFSESPTPGHQP